MMEAAASIGKNAHMRGSTAITCGWCSGQWHGHERSTGQSVIRWSGVSKGCPAAHPLTEMNERRRNGRRQYRQQVTSLRGGVPLV